MLFSAVVGRLLGDLDIVGMTFTHTGIGDLYETRVLQLGNAFGAEKDNSNYAGGVAEGWDAPPLNSDSLAVHKWTAEQLVEYLSTGWTRLHGAAAGPMASPRPVASPSPFPHPPQHPPGVAFMTSSLRLWAELP